MNIHEGKGYFMLINVKLSIIIGISAFKHEKLN